MSKKIYVTLDIGRNPEVRVDQVIWGKRKMKWVQDKDSIDFEFVDVKDLPEVGFNKKVDDKEIEVTDGMIAGDYEYTIVVVTPDGKEYTTTELVENVGADPDERKPVIRN